MGRPAGFAGGEGLGGAARAYAGRFLQPVLGRRENKRKKSGQQANDENVQALGMAATGAYIYEILHMIGASAGRLR
jgi:hypothetical protein